jgi:hypothetical protein
MIENGTVAVIFANVFETEHVEKRFCRPGNRDTIPPRTTPTCRALRKLTSVSRRNILPGSGGWRKLGRISGLFASTSLSGGG